MACVQAGRAKVERGAKATPGRKGTSLHGLASWQGEKSTLKCATIQIPQFTAAQVGGFSLDLLIEPGLKRRIG